MPQKVAIPAITYEQLSGARQHTLGGTDNMNPSSFRFTCWSDSYSEAEAVSSAVKGALDNYTGTVNNVTIQASHFDSDFDVIDRRAGVDVLNRHGKSMDFRIWYNE